MRRQISGGRPDFSFTGAESALTTTSRDLISWSVTSESRALDGHVVVYRVQADLSFLIRGVQFRTQTVPRPKCLPLFVERLKLAGADVPAEN